ncbi:hypothetical protein BC332_25250 [Capsicum chinense]|nr:hypothetical protein BC332_25250 [Capsicum chinense]
MQEHYAESCVVARNEESITNTINELCIPAGSPWHIVDEFYVHVNCEEEFHLVLAIIGLKKRVIHVHDSISGTIKRDPPNEIHKLAVMLPTYLSDSGFFERTKRTDWATLDTYKDKLVQCTQLLNQHPFDAHYVQNIAQQACASL